MSMLRFLGMVSALALAVAPIPAQAVDVQVGNLVVETPWARATPGGAKVGVGYLAIVNIGDKADRLISVSSPIAERVEIHTTTMENGIMRMRKLDKGLELKPQEVIELKPGGMHLMFIGLKRPIVEGDKLPVEVTFAELGKVQLSFIAAKIGAAAAPGSDLIGSGGSSSGQGSSSGFGRAPGVATGETPRSH